MAELGADGSGPGIVQIVSADAEELHAFARGLGLKRRWFQDTPPHPHYDVFGSRPAAALKAGAFEVPYELLRECMALARRESRVVSIEEVLT
jgi:hypothetical protein